MLLELVVCIDVPKRDSRVFAVRFCVRVDNSVGEIRPLVVWSDVGKVDERVDCQGDPQGAALPRTRGDLLTRHLKSWTNTDFKLTFQ